MKAMICRNCGAGLEAHRIDTSLGVVSCSHCGSLHDIPANKPDNAGESSSSKAAAKPKRTDAALPSKFKVRRGAGNLEVNWPAGGLFPGIVLFIIAGAFAYVAMTSGFWFLIIGSIGLFYLAALRAFNKHRIRVDEARLEVSQGPLPALGSHKLNASDIVQLYTTEHKTRTQTSKAGHQSAKHTATYRKHYRLSANTRNNGRITVLSGLTDPHQALWLEQEIERVLGIVDKRVEGEHFQ